ncbi:alpha/beta hydrolase family protein [Brevibacillus reuszeri]|uniref:alpha/beta hydrolase family protein n=1 Tax=Brevibacillus reuszeri TaxID=54915 RepID=UPI0028A29FAA|nr:acetylxylan esterase [Brevibacillus reuszeri]
MFPAPEYSSDHVRAFFYQSLPYQGRETRIFAYYGLPEQLGDQPVPGVVLVHGGAGTAFKQWVKEWNKRGYAALAMDLEGHTPHPDDLLGEADELPAHSWSGPVKQGVFADYDAPACDQWMYHAVGAVLLGHSLLRSFAEVDENRIGMTGISWGGIITSLVAGIDERLRFSMPVYGCGFLYEPGTGYGAGFAAMPAAVARKMRRLWDPSTYLAKSRLPMLWVNSSNDTHFPLSIFVRSYELNKQNDPSSVLSIHHGMGHSYQEGCTAKELFAFADHIVKGGAPLVGIREARQEGDLFVVCFHSDIPVVRAQLYWCHNPLHWPKARWEVMAATVDESQGIITAQLPMANSCFFVNITDARGLTVSTSMMVDHR